MGNLVSGAAAVGAKSGGGKVVMADGSVRALSEPVSVAELMMDHPRHFVVDARVLKERQQKGGGASKVASLPADHVLGAGGVYVLLPATRGKVSAEEALRALTAARSRSMPGGLRRKLSSRKSRGADAGGMAVQHVPAPAVAEEEEKAVAVQHVPAPAVAEEEEKAVAEARPDGFEEHRPEFLSRELSSRGWKPSLNTIEERAAPKKVPHWLI